MVVAIVTMTQVSSEKFTLSLCIKKHFSIINQKENLTGKKQANI